MSKRIKKLMGAPVKIGNANRENAKLIKQANDSQNKINEIVDQVNILTEVWDQVYKVLK